ncbi:MAG: hypothetical protein ACFHHU_13460 [Porticoccaceae bacterium]
MYTAVLVRTPIWKSPVAWDMAHPGRVHHIDFLKESDHLIALKQAGFEVLNHQRQLIQPRFDSTRAMLSSVKRTGATNAHPCAIRVC